MNASVKEKFVKFFSRDFQLSDIPMHYEDFLTILEASDKIEEIDCVLECLEQEIRNQRAKDTGGEDGMKYFEFYFWQSFYFTIFATDQGSIAATVHNDQINLQKLRLIANMAKKTKMIDFEAYL